MFKSLSVFILAISICACSPENPLQQTGKTEPNKKDRVVEKEAQTKSQSTDQVRGIAKDFSVSESKVNDTASRAAELSGGNASKQDMLDAMKAATGR